MTTEAMAAVVEHMEEMVAAGYRVDAARYEELVCEFDSRSA